MRVNRSFDWLGRFPLAVDLADTVRLVQDEEVELLSNDDDLSGWVRAELPRFPFADAALGHLSEIHELRDAVRSVLLAHASGDSLPPRDLELLNAASANSPSYPTMDGDGTSETVELNDDRFQVFRAQVARSIFEVLQQEPASIAVCRAPSCGMLFVPENRRQRWCSPRCGNRARVARHAARTGQRRPSH